MLLHEIATNHSFSNGQNFDTNMMITEILTHLSQLMDDCGTIDDGRYELFFQTITDRIRRKGIEEDLDQYPKSVGDIRTYTPWFKCHLIIQRFRVRIIFFSPRLQDNIKETILLGNLKYDGKRNPTLLIKALNEYNPPSG